jgi:hypothetical protein
MRTPRALPSGRNAQAGVAQGCVVYESKEGMAGPCQALQRRILACAGCPSGETLH